LLMCTNSYVNCCQVDVYIFPQMDRPFFIFDHSQYYN